MNARYVESVRYHERARRSLSRGVSSGMKASQSPVPLCMSEGRGSRLWDIDGNEYIDFALSFGPMLLGQSPPVVLDAVRQQLSQGVGFGAGNLWEAPLAELVCDAVPSADAVIFSNTGTEAVQAAIRVARAATGRLRVVKFSGHYHGWLDSVHVAIPGMVGSGPGTSGQDRDAARQTSVCEWNDASALEALLADDVAAVIMEPINVNGGCLTANTGYIEEVRRLTRKAGALLIFDEVITGFRVSFGGAQEILGVNPDLTVLGKAMGSGFPISAVCGSADVMSVVDSGRVSHMGNFNGSPVAAAAAHATITYLGRNEGWVYALLDRHVARLAQAFEAARERLNVPLQFNRTVGAGFGFHSSVPVVNHSVRLQADVSEYERFVRHLLDLGVYAPTRGLWYVSTEHTESDIEATCSKILEATSAIVRSDP